MGNKTPTFLLIKISLNKFNHPPQLPMRTISNETFHHVKNIIDSQHEKKQHSCFLLYCSDPHRQKENIENRGRPEERNYDINYMININQKYEDIFSPYF